ncbi:MAG: DNA topoisomerase (ATP-hydrolyzing) [Thermodesulfobacteriota bacterium]
METGQSSHQRGDRETLLHEEVEKRYLAYALSTIVSRALPDVRDGLKPVHRRILYAMHGMGLTEAARMRKSAAVVGEVIGKFHPHGDQAAYEALVRMAQDFSLRYPLIEGSGNFGSVDGDSPAAMRYTETRLSPFAGLLLREIEQGTTDFRPTYDAMGQEPDLLPSKVPNILLNGSSGIAVGMSCSFPPHNLGEVIQACRAMIRNRDLGMPELLRHIKGPDFPTGGEVLGDADSLAQIYAEGNGSIRVRGTYAVEELKRARRNLVLTSIPYTVNKSRLIERIAALIRDKKLKQVLDVRDESTNDVRVVLELRSADVKPASVVAFLYKYTDLQVNFPVNMIAITPQGVPDRLSLQEILRFFLDFRYEKTVRLLEHRLRVLKERIHILEGFAAIFRDLDRALTIIRRARSKQEAADGLKTQFPLDDAQVDAILEMKLYRLVSLEIGKLLDELAAKAKEAEGISVDLASSERLWKIVDTDLAEIGKKFADPRRTAVVAETEAPAVEYDPEEFVEREDATVILSRQGWIRRIKSEVSDPVSLKFREGDGLFGIARVNTGNTVALFSNVGKVYVLRVTDVPQSAGFGEPVGNMLNLADGEFMVGFLAREELSGSAGKAADPVCDNRDNGPTDAQLNLLSESLPGETLLKKGCPPSPRPKAFETSVDSGHAATSRDVGDRLSCLVATARGHDGFEQTDLFSEPMPDSAPEETAVAAASNYGIVLTRTGKGFRFGYEVIQEPTKRAGRRLIALAEGDEVPAVKAVEGDLLAVATDAGKILVCPVEQVSVLSGAGQGVRIMKPTPGAAVVAFETVSADDALRVQPTSGKEKVWKVQDIPSANRATQGKTICAGITAMERVVP